jgi:GNAT superfamily N-acetyltransferase
MASMNIRDVQPEQDAEAVVALLREVNPVATVTAASWVHGVRAVPARAGSRTWVAEVDGQIAGRAVASRELFGGGSAWFAVGVGVAFRRQGVGSALYDVAYAHAASLSDDVVTNFYETPEGVRFAEARGFRESRAEQLSVLDPRIVTDHPAAEVRPLTEADLRDAHRIDEATTADIPMHEPITEIPYDEWVGWVLEEPLFTRAGSFLAYADGEPAAVSLLKADIETGRAENWMLGTLPEFRGRGLGTAAKLATIQWAAANGITQMFTTNDETNAPMLAINRRLGYVPAGRRVEYTRRP